MKKSIISTAAWIVVLLVFVPSSLAGATLHYGGLAGSPSDGTVTYIAYLTESNGNEILTEDGYNAGLGPDQGYQSGYWLLAVANFDTEDAGDEVHISFAGIGAQEGKGGSLTFNWDNTTSFTDHGEILFSPVSNPATPTNLVAAAAGFGTIQLTWTDNTNGTATYRLYRSTQASGAYNDRSNGHYYRILPFDYQCTLGTCVGNDTTALTGRNWYIVTAEGSLSAHSEESKSEPTGVRLDFFTATPDEGQILLQWQTVTEVDNLGFSLYRAEDVTGERVLMNESLILSSAPGSASGASYEFVDESVVVGTRYYYWLQAMDVYGATTLHGPVTAILEVLEDRYPIYLPLIVRD